MIRVERIKGLNTMQLCYFVGVFNLWLVSKEVFLLLQEIQEDYL